MLKTNYTLLNITKEENLFIYVFGSIEEEVVFNIACCVLLLITLTGNSLVIFMILSSKSLQTAFNLLILNMAIADLVCGLAGLLFYGSFVFKSYINSKNGFISEMVYNIIACQFILCISDIFVKISVFIVALISLERYLLVKYPLKHKNYITKKKTFLTIVFLWILSILLSTPLILYILKAFKNDHTMNEKRSRSCHHLAISKKMPSKVVILIELMAGYVFPMAIIAITSYKIIKILWRPVTDQQGTNIAVLRSRRQVTKLLLCIVVSFNVFFLPWAVWLVLVLNGTITSMIQNEKLLFSVILIQFANSGANPLLYSIRSRNFRKKLTKMLCQKAQQKNLER